MSDQSSSDDPKDKPAPKDPAAAGSPQKPENPLATSNSEKNSDLLNPAATDESLSLTVSGRLIAQKGDGPYGGGNDGGGGGDGGA